MENTTAKISAKEVRKALLGGGNYGIVYPFVFKGLVDNVVHAKKVAALIQKAGGRCVSGVWAHGFSREECILVLDIDRETLSDLAPTCTRREFIHNGGLYRRTTGGVYDKADQSPGVEFFKKDAPKPEGDYADVAGVRFALNY